MKEMARSWVLCSVLIFIAMGKISAQGGPPKVTGSYKASGEMVETLEDDSQILVQIAFEESYNAETKDGAFNVWVMGTNVTFVENYKTNQTFRYTNGSECTLMTTEEWIKTKSPPSLISYEDTNGTVRFSLKQLFALSDSHLDEKEKNISSEFRGIPARKWMYKMREIVPGSAETTTVSVYAYWSDGTWDTTSNEEVVPLGYIVQKLRYKRGEGTMKMHEQFINVFSFIPDAIDHKLFEPVQGVVCEGKKSTVPFPDVNNMQTLAFHSEVIFPDYQQISYVDTWFDPVNKLLRQDMERIKDEIPVGMRKSRKYQSEMVIGKLGIAYRLGYLEGKLTCSVIPIPDFDFDIQNLINFKLKVSDWSIGKMFGVNQTQYIYIGKTSKRDIPCHLFQSKRKDWPEPSANVESLWEWCFSTNVTTKDDSVIFRNGEYGLVNVQINILKSGRPADIPVGYRIFHHFYDVNLMDPKLMDATYFDIGTCFDDTQKRRLQFVVDWRVTDDSIHLVENATSDLNFLQQWKNAIYRSSGLDPNSLRISALNSVILDKALYVKFTILEPHPGLPDSIKKVQISAFDAEKKLRESINSGSISVSYIPSKGAKALRLGVNTKSLTFQVNDAFEPHILPSTTPGPVSTKSTRIPFSLLTEPDEEESTPAVSVTDSEATAPSENTSPSTKTSIKPSSSTAVPTTESLKDKKTLHKAGTVAAVSIAMLAIGITIGSAGMFVKTNGMPPCLKCPGFTSS